MEFLTTGTEAQSKNCINESNDKSFSSEIIHFITASSFSKDKGSYEKDIKALRQRLVFEGEITRGKSFFNMSANEFLSWRHILKKKKERISVT